MGKNGVRKVGRPPAGDDGVAVRDYPRITLRLTPPVRARLEAWHVLTGVQSWRLIEQAIGAAIDALPAEERRGVERLARQLAPRFALQAD